MTVELAAVAADLIAGLVLRGLERTDDQGAPR